MQTGEFGNRKNSDEHPLPYVTIVVPVLNAPQRVQHCLEGLLHQTYPRDCYEIIVIDNGSTDNTPQVIQEYPVTFLVEASTQSPYAARNKGIKHARGEIIAMLDVNCTPIPQWLQNGIRSLEAEAADLVGGKVTFTFSPEKTAAEMFDSIANVEIKNNIQARGVAKGGNLFVRKHVFEVMGLFPAHLRSGGDVLWTGRATRAGFSLVYSSETEVFYPARKLRPLLKKQYRVGGGQVAVWFDQRKGFRQIIRSIILGFRPPSLTSLRNMIRQRGTDDMERRLGSIWLVAWICTVMFNLGRVRFILKSLLSPILEDDSAKS